MNSQKEIVSYLDESLDRMPEEEAEKYLALLKKTLSGALGRWKFWTAQSKQTSYYREKRQNLQVLPQNWGFNF